jgi:hypothetical protein
MDHNPCKTSCLLSRATSCVDARISEVKIGDSLATVVIESGTTSKPFSISKDEAVKLAWHVGGPCLVFIVPVTEA